MCICKSINLVNKALYTLGGPRLKSIPAIDSSGKITQVVVLTREFRDFARKYHHGIIGELLDVVTRNYDLYKVNHPALLDLVQQTLVG